MGQDAELKTTPLTGLHRALGARMVPFAGYEMPVQFDGVMAEHTHTRAAAGLFDVSHMGQVLLRGDGAAEALEQLVPQAVVGLSEGRQRYAFLTNETGGILDDLMVAARSDGLFLVVNAANKAADIARFEANMDGVEPVTDRALLALQGPAAVMAFARVAPDAAALGFMRTGIFDSPYGPLWVSRSGYTGEDGVEVSVPAEEAEALAQTLLAMDEVKAVGLGARDSLRLEAGLCLHGADIGPETTPVEARLSWAIQKSRRPGGSRAGGYPGATRIAAELAEGAARSRVGLLPMGRAPMRAGTTLHASEDGPSVGQVTSGAFGPSVGGPISMGYVPSDLVETGTTLFGEVRGKRLPVQVVPLPFHPHAYRR